MIDCLLVNEAPGEMRIALLDGERVVEISHHRADSISLLGNLYLGRVTAMHALANGAFVDLGEDRPGFLNAGDARIDAIQYAREAAGGPRRRSGYGSWARMICVKSWRLLVHVVTVYGEHRLWWAVGSRTR